MSEPITLYCVEAHDWKQVEPGEFGIVVHDIAEGERFRVGDAMTTNSPSLSRSLLASGRWSLEAPAPVQAPVVVAPVEAPVVAPAPAQPVTPKRKPRRL